MGDQLPVPSPREKRERRPIARFRRGDQIFVQNPSLLQGHRCVPRSSGYKVPRKDEAVQSLPKNPPALLEQKKNFPTPPITLHAPPWPRSEEHTSELQSLMRISYAVFCLKKKKK